ncbi:MAG: phosphoribosylanthranilate isomerase [Gammaproteobacteria bacterium]|nr:phosphoribosylanthranilate isomerase [Gammaproteobacteria bacterium]
MVTTFTSCFTARVKICGITRPQDAQAAAERGADAIGLVFYEPSPRAVSIEQAQSIVSALPPFVTVVGLFVDASRQRLEEVLGQVPIDLLQFHGTESPEQCEAVSHKFSGKPYIKAIRMRADIDVVQQAQRYASASALLLDAYQPGVPGGTGERFEWSRVPQTLDKPIVLAGGLNDANVAKAVEQVQPYAVDVSGGVEGGVPGIKDHQRIAAFIHAAKHA